jgi:MerR family transcriptional regulator, thiopeptide resistance regulator
VGYAVGQVAALAGITVRTLHHYDEIGLLSPSDRTAAGYRSYGEDDLERLAQVLFYRGLGLSLVEIGRLLDEPGPDVVGRLRRQHEALTSRIASLSQMLAAVEKEMEACQMGIKLTPEERLEVFGEFRQEHYEDEAAQRWGETGAYRESSRRTSRYGKEQWAAIKSESAAIEADFAAALRAGTASGSDAGRALAERHRQHLCRWFYDCRPDMHRGLAEMYVTDERFAAYYEELRPGLAVFVRDAIAANAEHLGGR